MPITTALQYDAVEDQLMTVIIGLTALVLLYAGISFWSRELFLSLFMMFPSPCL
jgi:hypothetical protein